jgi:cyclic pyranopterin phosphate synthase
MPESGVALKTHEELLTFEEITSLSNILSEFGIRKIRITGGEPLMRRGVADLISSLNAIPAIEEVTLTTNGTLLPFYVHGLKKAGLKRINISLDTLQKDKFQWITGNNYFTQVMEGIKKAQEHGFSPIKINMVVMRGVNDDEIRDFVNFSLSQHFILRFIEFMKVTPLWKEQYYVPIEHIIRICEDNFKIERILNKDPSPAIYYRIGGDGHVGFIRTDENKCRECTRLRVLSTGILKVCLYEKEGVPLRDHLRNDGNGETVREVIRDCLAVKEKSTYRDFKSSGSYMCGVGG